MNSLKRKTIDNIYEEISCSNINEAPKMIADFISKIEEVTEDHVKEYLSELVLVINFYKEPYPNYCKWFKYELSELLFKHFDDDEVVSFSEESLKYFEVKYPKDSTVSTDIIRIIDEIKSFLTVTALRRKKIRKYKLSTIKYFVI